ncbi:hypothetical protein P9265_18870 [Schinkia azotoformans]|nr:hypothetical protein [Schinkia azotoformans]
MRRWFPSLSFKVSHYIDTLQATVLNPRTRQLVIDTNAAKRLVSTYF